MNEQVEKFIKEKKEAIENVELEKRKKHLRIIGLIEKKRTYQKQYDFKYNIYDEERKEYYYETKGAIEVTDAEYAEICKYYPPFKEKEVKYAGSGVKTLYGFGIAFYIIASIAILITIIGIFTYFLADYSKEQINGLSLASSFFPIAISSFAGGAICQGLSTIAKTALFKKTLLEEQYNFE
ncbi:MAG: hypothetical protein LBU83_00260 [Bacteroidales bacterium]|nr:hypothetical protein [Bacteroidales bacterium]